MAATEPRTAQELVSLLLELARVVKARRYFEPGDKRLRPVFDHTRRAWAADLRRHGPIEVSLEGRRLEQGGQSVPVDGRLEREMADWDARGIWRLRVEPDADAEAFAGLVEVLAMEPEDVEAEGGASTALARRVPEGVRIEAPNDAPGLPVLKPEPAAEDLPPAVHAATPPTEPGEPVEPVASGEPVESIEAVEPVDAVDSIDLAAPADPDEDTDVFRNEAQGEAEEGEDEAPLAARSGSDTEPLPPPVLPPSGEDTEPVGLRLSDSEDASSGGSATASDQAAAILRELEGADDGDESYRERLADLVRLVEAERLALGIAAVTRILSALSEECQAKRGEATLNAVRSAIDRLCVEEVLDTVLEEAAGSGPPAERAAGILSQLGDHAGLAIAVRALTEEEPARAEKLAEHWLADDPLLSAGPIYEALASPDPPLALRAVELATRLYRHRSAEEVVSHLADALRNEEPAVQEAAAQALAGCASAAGGDDAQALRALARGLQSEEPGLAALCAQSLATTASPRAVPVLAEALHAAVEARDVEAAKDRIRALADLGRPEGARELGAVLLRKSLRSRRRLRELKLAAAHALTRLPGDEAVGVLSQAAQLRDAQVREAAQIALERRSAARRSTNG